MHRLEPSRHAILHLRLPIIFLFLLFRVPTSVMSVCKKVIQSHAEGNVQLHVSVVRGLILTCPSLIACDSHLHHYWLPNKSHLRWRCSFTLFSAKIIETLLCVWLYVWITLLSGGQDVHTRRSTMYGWEVSTSFQLISTGKYDLRYECFEFWTWYKLHLYVKVALGVYGEKKVMDTGSTMEWMHMMTALQSLVGIKTQ